MRSRAAQASLTEHTQTQPQNIPSVSDPWVHWTMVRANGATARSRDATAGAEERRGVLQRRAVATTASAGAVARAPTVTSGAAATTAVATTSGA